MLTSIATVAVSVALPWMSVAGSVAVMVAVPIGPAVASPCDPAAFEIRALALDEDHVALCVRFIVDPSVYVPIAMYCCVSPLATDCVAGLTAIETRAAAVAVSVAVPEMPDTGSVAVTTLAPRLTDVARPAGIVGAFATLIEPLEEAHVALFVRTCVDLSLYVPVAVSCRNVPKGRLAVLGVIATDTRIAEVTVTLVAPAIPVVGSVAVTKVVPGDSAVPRPYEPLAFETVITPGDPVLQVTPRRSCVEWSVKVPVATNCSVSPDGKLGEGGVMAIDTSLAGVIVRVVEPETDRYCAAIPVFPTTRAVASP
jgi:hypothetical protein